MTPSKMVAMRAVFGREVTPKLKMPNDETSSSRSKTATFASDGKKASTKAGVSPKSVTKQSGVKVTSLKKSVRKSTAKKTLWSEVVKRAAAAQKSGPKIVKPVIVKVRKMKAAATAVVSIVSQCCICVASCYSVLFQLNMYQAASPPIAAKLCPYQWPFQPFLVIRRY